MTDTKSSGCLLPRWADIRRAADWPLGSPLPLLIGTAPFLSIVLKTSKKMSLRKSFQPQMPKNFLTMPIGLILLLTHSPILQMKTLRLSDRNDLAKVTAG